MPKAQEDQLSAEQLEGVLAENAAASEDSIEDMLREALKEDAGEAEEEETTEGSEGGQEAAEDEADEEATDGAEAAEAAPDGEDEAGEGDESETIEPPADWSAEDHERFHKLDAETQKWMVGKTGALTDDFGKERESFQADKQRLDSLDRVIGPRLDGLKMQGLDAPRAIEQLFTLSDFASSQPEDFIKWFAQNRQIDLGQLAGATTQTPQNGAGETADTELFDDATTRALRQHIQGLEQQINNLAGGLQTREQQEQQLHAQQQQQTIDAFKTETDESGKPKHPFFEDVRAHMGSLMRDGHASDLSAAYEQAVRAHPEVWRKIEAGRQAAADREASKTRRKKATAAKKAGSSISGTSAASTSREVFADPADELRAVAEESGARI